MSVQSRKARGMRSQLLVAEYAREWGWRYATPAGAGAHGVDVLNTPGVAIEVKARRRFNPLEWYKQAAKNAGDDLPVVVMRPDGAGENVDDWLMFVRAVDGFALLRREAMK